VKVVAWGFSMPSLCEAFAREIARLPGRNDLILQIDAETRTIDFSSVRVTEFLRTDFMQLENLARGIEKDQSASVVFDMWRFLFSDSFDVAMEAIVKIASTARRCVLVVPPRASHLESLVRPRSGDSKRTVAGDVSDALLARVWERTLAIYERFLNVDSDVTLLSTSPPVEAFWSLLGANTLKPAKSLGLSFAPRALRESPMAFTSMAAIARELSFLLAKPDAADGAKTLPWFDVPVSVEISWPEGVRAFDCSWPRYAAKVASQEQALSNALPHFATPATRGSVARALSAYGAFEKVRSLVSGGLAPNMTLLFPPSQSAP
jgi:hypothetical protein